MEVTYMNTHTSNWKGFIILQKHTEHIWMDNLKSNFENNFLRYNIKLYPSQRTYSVFKSISSYKSWCHKSEILIQQPESDCFPPNCSLVHDEMETCLGWKFSPQSLIPPFNHRTTILSMSYFTWSLKCSLWSAESSCISLNLLRMWDWDWANVCFYHFTQQLLFMLKIISSMPSNEKNNTIWRG